MAKVAPARRGGAQGWRDSQRRGQLRGKSAVRSHTRSSVAGAEGPCRSSREGLHPAESHRASARP
eukprot:7461889-Alexandrium_andersonii.AAC.1